MTADDVEALVETHCPGARCTALCGGYLLELGGCSLRLPASASQSDVEAVCRELGAMRLKDAQAGAERDWRASIERRLERLEALVDEWPPREPDE